MGINFRKLVQWCSECNFKVCYHPGDDFFGGMCVYNSLEVISFLNNILCIEKEREALMTKMFLLFLEQDLV